VKQNTDQQNSENGVVVRWKGVSNDHPTIRAAWNASEGARISLRANNPPITVQRQVTMELGPDTVDATNRPSQHVRIENSSEGLLLDKNRSEAATEDGSANQSVSQSLPSDHQKLNSRFRFPFRRNDPAELKLELNISKTEESGDSNEKLENNTVECRSMSRTRPDSASTQLNKQEYKSSTQTDEAKLVAGDSGKGVFAYIRSKWEQEGNKNDSTRTPHDQTGRTSSLLEDSPIDIRHKGQVKSQAFPDSKGCLEGREMSVDPCLKSETKARSACVPILPPPTRSNSTKDLIKHMEAINKERRDRTSGPPVTKTTKGKMPRRKSESAMTPDRETGLMRNFRSSSFAYRNRGVSPSRNSTHHPSDYSRRTEYHSSQGPANTSNESKQLVNLSILVQSSNTGSSNIEGDRVTVSEYRASPGTGTRTTNNFRSSILVNESQDSSPEVGDNHPPLNLVPHSAPDAPIPSILLVGHDDPLAMKSVVRADRRRNLPQTYTEPLESSMSEDPDVEQFLKNFDLRLWRDEANLAWARYQDTLAMHHGNFVRTGVVRESDFWCRYFYRCDEKRILKDMRQKQKLGILGQSSRNILANPSDPGVYHGKAFARGPQFICQKESSSVESFNKVLKPVGSFISKEADDIEERHTCINGSNRAGGHDESTLKNKLKNWNNVTFPSSIHNVRTEIPGRHRSLTAEDRAKRYRNRVYTPSK
jgi:hypothetical protein